MDKMVSIKGLVIRSTPVIPDMKTGTIHLEMHQNMIVLIVCQLFSVARFVTML